ncbi:MAG: hypothetical protein QW728_05840 [Thermoplasmata archaeon]
MTVIKSPDGRFELVEIKKEEGSLMNSRLITIWKVRLSDFKDEILEFQGIKYHKAGNEKREGVELVAFSPNNSEVSVRRYDGTVQKYELPLKYAISEDTSYLILEYKDGRTERKKREPLPAAGGAAAKSEDGKKAEKKQGVQKKGKPDDKQPTEADSQANPEKKRKRSCRKKE